MLVREKPDVRIRISSRTVNKAVRKPVYTIPTIEEKLPFLTSAKVFTVVDVSEAFHNVELDYEPSLLTTFKGPNIRNRYKRMPFVISSGPEEYQRRQQEFLEGLDGVINIADDICVLGRGDTKEKANIDHDKNLIALLDKCKEQDLRLTVKKMQFKSTTVTFMGHKLTDQGICPDPGKVSAAREMPRPLDKVGVQHSQEKAFNAAKDLIASSTNLRYYDVKLPVTLQVDASDEAIGGVLIQEEKPVCFTSHTLTDTEKRYAQIEKECLAIMTSMKKWHQYLFGKHDIIVQTDHQPLETTFKKPLGKAPRRLQRMMLQLQQYNFEVVYKRGKELYVADTSLQAALKENCAVELESEMVFRVELEQMGLKRAMMSDCTLNRMKEETRKDQTLKCLLETVRKGWPSDKLMVPPCIRQLINL
ncbi:Hypothetical predicted protein [Paramuricea clavata]|uniref:Uncharacterized protein n=1 Tax=Paramuricea clavata TaxID=317549 RepID=A0A6S7L395_PARCT|nr:Hypothetical predicted protein [Paramuricea clavata]